ncbi:MAG: hypothetical protein BGN86_05710 [Caulobacterales bacterium 68-7]|nr:DUF2807 domain-containing protein [Caulobacterales bacterium]OJU14206.1 MAG: hypothetical protein BGN86_05710 [Caulobacterales bacterium 68-7]
MRAHILIGAVSALTVAATAGAAQAATKLEIKDAVARVTVIPEARSDVKVEVVKRHPGLPMDLRVNGDTVEVDGNLGRNAIRGCVTVNDKTRVNVRRVGTINFDDMPQLIVRTPMDANVRVGGAVFGEVRPSYSLEFSNVGCGNWRLADTRGLLELKQAGSGDVQAGRSGGLEIRVAGSGDVAAGPVATRLSVEIAGSGDVEVASVNGDIETRIAGSGDIAVLGGRAPRMEAHIAGSGDISFRGVAGSLQANIAGSGGIHADQVDGPVERHVMGSGEVTVGR